MQNWQELVFFFFFLLCPYFSCNLIREIWYEFEYLFIHIHFPTCSFLAVLCRKKCWRRTNSLGIWLCPNCATACVFIRCDLTNGDQGIWMRVNLFNRWQSNNNTNNKSTRNENKKSKKKIPTWVVGVFVRSTALFLSPSLLLYFHCISFRSVCIRCRTGLLLLGSLASGEFLFSIYTNL